MSLFRDDKNAPVRLHKKQEFYVPLDLLTYGVMIVFSSTLLLSILGGMF